MIALTRWGLPLQAQTTFVSDHFTTGSNVLLESHTPDVGGAWTRRLGASGLELSGAGDVLFSAGGSDWSLYTNAATPPEAEYVVGVTASFGNSSSNSFVELWGRLDLGSLSGYSVRMTPQGAVTLYRYGFGFPTLLASGLASIGATSTLILSVKNSAKEVWVDGTLIASSTDNTLAAAGIVGLGMQSNSVAAHTLDDFFASSFAPTEAKFISSEARRHEGKTLIEWRTGHESQNLGFRLYREEGGKLERVDDGLIAGSALLVGGARLSAGNVYRWIDDHPARAYWIEAVAVRGGSDWHGPIVPREADFGPGLTHSRLLRDRPESRSVTTPVSRPAASTLATPAAARHRSVDPLVSRQSLQWSLAGGAAVKIAVAGTGWLRVPRQQLLDAGLPAAVDPATLQLFADGSEMPITVEGEADGACEAIRFHGTGLDTLSTDTRVYWLVWGRGRGRRIATIASGQPGGERARSFAAEVERRDRTVYFAALRNGEADNFFGPVVSTSDAEPTLQLLHVTHLDRSESQAQLSVVLQGASTDSAAEILHRVMVTLNGHAAGEVDFYGLERGAADFSVPADWLSEENRVALVARGGDEDVSAVESVRLVYRHTFTADGDQFFFSAQGGATVTLDGFSSADVRLLDVTSAEAPFELVPAGASGGEVTFVAQGTGLRTIVAVAGGHYASPRSVTANEASSIHDASGDLVVIAHPGFADALQPLVDLRRAEGHAVVVVTTTDVYDEFGFGAKSPAAIRSFLNYAAGHWPQRPRWCLLLGDATFDPRDYLGRGDFDFVPTKLIPTTLLETASDAWLADFDGDGTAEVAVGRLPVRSIGEARTAIGKIVAYENAAPQQPWMTKVLSVVDADPKMGFADHAREATAAVGSEYSFETVDAGAIGAAAARAKLEAGFDAGAILVDYVGHGSVEQWSAGGAIFDAAEAAARTNGERLPLVLAITCLNGYFHDIYTESLAEALLLAPKGGAVAVWASSSLTSPDLQAAAHRAFLAAIFGKGGNTIGEAAIAAQHAAIGPNVRRSFILFGDPSMRVRRAE